MSLIIIFFRICFKPWISLRQTNESRPDLSTLFSFWNSRLAIFFCASIFQNTGVRSSSFSESSALNSSFVSTMISSTCSHHLSSALTIERTALVWNQGKFWIHRASFIISVLCCWRTARAFASSFVSSISGSLWKYWDCLCSSLFAYRSSLPSLCRFIFKVIAAGACWRNQALLRSCHTPGTYTQSQPLLCFEMKARTWEKVRTRQFSP